MRTKWIISLVVAFVFVFPLLISADTMIKQVNERGAFEMMGQKVPATSDTSMVWLGDKKARADQGDSASVIIDVGKNMIYMIDNNKKTYSEMSLDDLGDIDKMLGDNEEAKQMVKGMMAMMKMEVTVTPSDETQKIGDWDCKKYDVSVNMGMGTSDMVIWATDDVDVDYNMFMEVTNSFKAIMPGFDKMIEEMKKVEGLPIKTLNTTKMMGSEATSVMEVIEIADKDAPAGTYKVPEGYTKTEMQMPGMQGK